MGDVSLGDDTAGQRRAARLVPTAPRFSRSAARIRTDIGARSDPFGYSGSCPHGLSTRHRMDSEGVLLLLIDWFQLQALCHGPPYDPIRLGDLCRIVHAVRVNANDLFGNTFVERRQRIQTAPMFTVGHIAADRILEAAKSGERDPDKLRDWALTAFGRKKG